MVSDSTLEKITTIIVIGCIAVGGLLIAPDNNEVFLLAVAAIAGIAGFTLPGGFCVSGRKE